MRWTISWRTDPEVRPLADRHYNRQSIGAPNFAPPGRCMVLKYHAKTGSAFWITSWPYAEFVKHAWAGAWVCSAFRNETGEQSSPLITEALAATQYYYYGTPPELGMITFIDRKKVPPMRRRGKDHWGYSYERAGFVHVGETKSGLPAYQMYPFLMPPPAAPLGCDIPHKDAA